MIQKTKNISLLSLTVSSFFILSSCSSSSEPETAVLSGEHPETDPSVLRVSMEAGTPGYFRFNGEALGYTYDLLDAYAASLGQTLEVIPQGPGNYIQTTHRSAGLAEMTVTLQPYSTPGEHTVIPVYETSYVILGTSRKMRSLNRSEDIYTLLSGQNICFSPGFSSTQEYDRMLEELSNVRLRASEGNVFESMEKLINGKYDFLICEKSEAQLGRTLIRNIETLHEFEEPVTVCMVLDRSRPEEGRRFTNWLHHFRQSEASDELHNLYFEKGIAQRIISGGIKDRPKGSISVYDNLFKKAAKEENLDWRLVSAIAYSESKYNAYLVSPRGARGLMQVMPATARAFQVDPEELMDPEANVKVAVKLIRNIEKSLKFAPGTPQEDRTSMMLACYNGGIGHVTDARRLASKYGANPDSWQDVSQYLRLKSQPEYAEDEVVRCGAFKGARETLNFVNHVMGKYYAYCGNAN